MKSLRYVVGLAMIGAALTVVPAVQQAAAGDAPAPAVREPSLVQKVREGARGSVDVSSSRATGKVSSMRVGVEGDLYPSNASRPRGKADAFLRQYARAFGAPYGQLVRATVKKDRIGSTTLSYVQRYQGVPVFGAMLRLTVDKQGDLTSVGGSLAPMRNASMTKTISARQAAARSVALVRSQPPAGEDGRKVATRGLKTTYPQLVVYRHGLVQGIDKNTTELAYQVEVTNRKNIREMVFVSANGGKVVNRYSLMDDALYRVLYEAELKQNGTISFKKVWEEGDNRNKLKTVDQANMIDSTGEAYWLFENAFGRDSYDAAGAHMIVVNNDPRIDCPNANWNGVTTNYCDGVSSDDVVAHEWGHAYTEYTSGLIYQWQPGAMNEAYSDVWGETVDLINGRQDADEGDIVSPRPVGLCSTHTAAVPLLTINSPAAIAKDCLTGGASFGKPLTATGITGNVVVATDVAEPADADPAGTTTDGCSPYTNAAAVVGNIAMVDRGRCSFEQKARVATAAGASALIIGNRDDSVISMAGSDTTLVSTVSIGLTDRESIRTALAVGTTVNVTMKDAGGARYDSFRWLIGEDSTAFGGAIRDMWNPTCLGDPGKVTDVEYKCSADDAGGVHGNSGVVNHDYALLVDGGTFNNVAVAGIGLDKAANIFWRAQNTKLVPTSGFPELADALEASCAELVGQPINELSTAANDATVSTDLITAGDCAQVAAANAAVELRVDPTVQCGWLPQLDKNTPALCGAGNASTTVFSEDFEGAAGTELDGWVVTNASVYGSAALPWESAAVPHGEHAGKVAKGPAPAAGQCDGSTNDISGASFLTSGNIVLPAAGAPKMQFTHYVATEDSYDGGNVQLSVNGGAFAPVPASAYTFNKPRALATSAAGNTNPLAGQDAFTGSDPGSVFGSWGESQIDLAAAGVAPGSTIQVRFAIGRDGCGGNDGWYVDDVLIVACTAGTGPTATATATATATGTSTATPSPTPTAPPAAKVATTTKVKKPTDAPAFKDDFKIQVKVLSSGVTATGKVVVKYQGETIGKGKLVNGKVKIKITKNLKVGKHELVAKYKGSSTALKSKKKFTIKIV